MGTETAIAWTDHTFNPWIGCAKVHTGCNHCYAESFAKRYGKADWGSNGTRVMTSNANWRLPLKWNREAEKLGVRKRVFCASLADVFEDWQLPIMGSGKNDGTLAIDDSRSRLLNLDDVRRQLFKLIDATPNLDWLLLTKRPENIAKMMPDAETDGNLDPRASAPYGHASRKYRSNVWLGTSVSDQATADKAIPELLKCRDFAPVLFLSAEPLVGPVYLNQIAREWKHPSGLPEMDRTYFDDCLTGFKATAGGGWTDPTWHIDWVIFGGESGHGARPCEVDWIRNGVKQCRAAGVAPFVKQLGAKPIPNVTMSNGMIRFINDSKGGDMAEWPEDLRVQEFPALAAAGG